MIVSPASSARSPPATAANRSSSAPLGSSDRDEARVEQLAQPAGDEVEQPVEVGLGRERVADLVQRLELARPAGRRLVEARVLDRDRRLAREQLDELLVLLGEVLAAGLLGQVEVAVGDAAQMDRHAEEGAHRRVVRREADRARILGEVVEPQRRRRRGSARRGSRGRAGGRRSRRASRRRCRWSGSARAAEPLRSITPSAA